MEGVFEDGSGLTRVPKVGDQEVGTEAVGLPNLHPLHDLALWLVYYRKGLWYPHASRGPPSSLCPRKQDQSV